MPFNKTTLTSFLPFEATPGQINALTRIEAFVHDQDTDFLILKGSAGTGKTSILKAVALYLEANTAAVALLAPTAKAAKNIAEKTGFTSHTIHSHIYLVSADLEQGVVSFLPKPNTEEERTIYVIDESSMISDSAFQADSDFISPRNLLGDLIRYAKQGNRRNKLILAGDECQLPPIGYTNGEQAPAMDIDYLRRAYALNGKVVELTQTAPIRWANSIRYYLLLFNLDCVLGVLTK